MTTVGMAATRGRKEDDAGGVEASRQAKPKAATPYARHAGGGSGAEHPAGTRRSRARSAGDAPPPKKNCETLHERQKVQELIDILLQAPNQASAGLFFEYFQGR